MVPVEYLDRWITKYQSWKAFIFESIRLRMGRGFHGNDRQHRVHAHGRTPAQSPRDRVRVLGKTEIETTHQQIADDLHTSRVVVSRLIKQLRKSRRR